MSQFCPNISHPDWKYSVDKLGKDKTLLLYDAADQRIPTKDEVDTMLSNTPLIYNKQQVIDLLMGELSDEQKEIVRPELEQMDKDEFDKEALKAGLNKLGNFYTPSAVQRNNFSENIIDSIVNDDSIYNTELKKLPIEIYNTIKLVDLVPDNILGNSGIFFAMKDVFADAGITDPLLINWAGINKDIIGHPKNIKSEKELENIVEDVYKEKLNKNKYIEFKTNKLASESFDKWVSALNEYPIVFKDIMLKHAIKYITKVDRNSKYVLQLSSVALMNTYGILVNKPHEANRLGKLYDEEVLKTVSDAVGHEQSESGKGYWVHVPKTDSSQTHLGYDSYENFSRNLDSRIEQIEKNIASDKEKLKPDYLEKLESELKQLENKEPLFYSQEPGLTREDANSYGFNDYSYVRVESSYSRGSSPHPTFLGNDYKGYYIHGYNTESGKPSTRVIPITKEEAEKIWEKEIGYSPIRRFEVNDQQKIYNLQSEIKYVKTGNYNGINRGDLEANIKRDTEELNSIKNAKPEDWEYIKDANTQHKVNVELLKKLSPSTWCTSGESAHYYVETYDNYILIVNGITVVGIEASTDLNSEGKRIVHEVTSRNNNSVASIDHLDDTLAFFKKHNLDETNFTIVAAINQRDLGKTDKDISSNNEELYEDWVDVYGHDENWYIDQHNGEHEYDPPEDPEDVALEILDAYNVNTIDDFFTLNEEQRNNLYSIFYSLPSLYKNNERIIRGALEIDIDVINQIDHRLSFYYDLIKENVSKKPSLYEYLTAEDKAKPEFKAIHDAEEERIRLLSLEIQQKIDDTLARLQNRSEDERNIALREALNTNDSEQNIIATNILANKDINLYIYNNDDLPFSKTNNNRIQGYYDPKTDNVVVVKSNTPIKEVTKVAIHEVAHRGIMRMAKDLGGMKELIPILLSAEKELMKKLPDLLKRTGHTSLDNLMLDYGFVTNSVEGKTKLLIELSARWAETLIDKPQPIWWKNFIKAISKWITKFTGKILNEQEVNELVGGFVRYGTKKTVTNSFKQRTSSKATETKEEFITRMNSRIENGMYKQKDGTLVPITDDSNPEVWWVENTEKLVEFKQNKIFNEYTENEVRSKIKDLRAKYMTEGYIFNSIKSGDKYIIQVVKPIKRESQFTLEDIVNHLDENQDIINRYLDNMVGKSVNSIILSLLEEDISEETRYLLPILQYKLSENPGLNLVISNSVIFNEDGKIEAAKYEYDTNTITINREAFTGKNANISTLADTIAHEIIHSYTVLAIERSQESFATEKDKEFYRTMNRLYMIAKRKTKYPKAHAYISLKEFVTGVLTDPKIMEECKEMKISVWRRILNAIGKVLGITSVYQHSLDTIVEFIQTGNEFDFRMTDFQIDIVNRNLDEDRYLQTNNPAHVAYWKILNKYSQDIEFDPVKHEYRHKESNLSLIPTTTSLQKASIIGTYVSSDEETRNKAEAAKNRGKDLGNITHAISEAEIKGIALRLIEQNNFKYTDSVVKKISDIIKSIYKPGDTVLSEVLVANLNKRIGGHIDLLIIDKNNKIHIYDFKTKEKGFGYYLTENSFGRSLPMSDKDRHACQLSIYSDCLESMLGEKATSMNIIMIKPTVEEDTIVDINLDKTHSENGVLTVDYNYSVYSVYDLLEMESPEEVGKEIFDEDKPDPAEVNATIEEEKRLFENFASQAQVLSAREIIVQQSIKALIHKREIASRKGRTFERVPLEKLIDKLLAEKDVEIQLINIINYANEQSIRIWNQYLEYKNEEKEIPLRVLYSWKDSVSAFNALLDDQDGLNSIITRENGFVGGPDYRNMLESTMKRVSQIKTLYEYVGTEKLVDFLSPYYNKLYAELRLSKTKEYRLRKFLGKIPADVTEKDYVEKAVTEQGEDLKMRTKNLIRVELKKASNDIGLLTRWMDNLLDTTDPVTAAMVKAFVYRDEEARIQSLAKRDEMTLLVRELEQFYSKSGKIPRSMEDFYGFMLERDKDGNLTGHYTHKSLSTLDDDLSKVILASKNLSSYDQRKKLISNWLELNNPLDKAAFKTAYWEYIIELYNTQKLTDKEYRVLEDQTYLTNKLSINEMIEKGLIREDIGSEIRKWFSSNMENYRVPSSKYENPQWKELSKILQNPEDPRTKFYNYVVDLGKEATMFLPESTSLKTRLPGIIKQNYERAAAGQSIGTIIRNGIGKEFTFRTDDTHRHKKILDEEGNEKYFLPIHFTGKLDIEDQSFDLASIYYKYWEMANDYNHKSQILPEMELAKFLIEKRTATKRTFSGKAIINKRKDSKYEDIPEEAIINRTRLAEQVHDWFASCVYGQTEADEGTLLGVDLGKFANFINKYTSMNLLAANFVQGTANVVLGETLQRIEGFAGEYMSNSSWLRADKFYLNNLVGMAGDIGKRSPDNLGTKINEFLGVLDNYGRADLNRRTKFGRMSAIDTLFFTSSLGEHYMQTRFAIGMLGDIKAYDKDGKELGSMLDMYNVNNKGQLVLDDKVDLIKSKWTESDVIDFKIKVRGVLSRLHGEYSELGKVAIQRYALGRMAYMFRKFIIPGFRRRYGRMSYNERLGQFTEGSYVTTFKFLGNAVFKPMFGKEATDPEAAFINRLIEDLGSYKMSIFKARWAMLSDHEKANITRTVSEVGFLIVAIILANIAMSFKGGGDDDAEEQFWAFIAYQAYRFQNELLFFTPKLDSAMSILRSPAASMSVVENLIKLSGQVFHPGDVYERGNWKGKLKITRTLVDMVPVRRQLYRLSNIEDNLTWIQQSAFGGKRDREERKNSSYLP